jgi:hypothetical protein
VPTITQTERHVLFQDFSTTITEPADDDRVVLFNTSDSFELVTVEDFMGALQTVMETCNLMLSQMNSRLYSFQSALAAGPAVRVDGSGATQTVTGTVSANLSSVVVGYLPAAATQQILAAEVRKQIVTS